MIEFLRFLRNVASPNPDRRLFTLRQIATLSIRDYRLTWHQMDWWSDGAFNSYLDQFGEREGYNTHRRWMVAQLQRLVAGVPGDTAECGVWKGISSWMICAGNEGTGRLHHMFDSFEGLSAPSGEDGSYWTEGTLAAGEDFVKNNLRQFEGRFVTYKGWIPKRFAEVADKRFCFVHVDVDLHAPTRESIEFFYPRLEDGAIFLCDDFGMSTCPGATKAINDYLVGKPEKMVSLDAGGGFFIKGVRTAPNIPGLARATE